MNDRTTQKQDIKSQNENENQKINLHLFSDIHRKFPVNLDTQLNTLKKIIREILHPPTLTQTNK